MSTYGARAEQNFREGCNCAQAVLLAFANVTGFDDAVASKLGEPFGAGMGQLREVCGAFTGALMVLGMADGSPDPRDRTARRELYGKVQQLGEEFKSRHGSLVCGELLGLRTPPGAFEKLPRKQPCPILVRTTADMLAEMLELHADS
ncbi:MAG: C_GCAxxG_C_C family protein [Clostridia bacterium]|nr:C_GCAxxG_C_C family protein [Clostridia bacterium]